MDILSGSSSLPRGAVSGYREANLPDSRESDNKPLQIKSPKTAPRRIQGRRYVVFVIGPTGPGKAWQLRSRDTALLCASAYWEAGFYASVLEAPAVEARENVGAGILVDDMTVQELAADLRCDHRTVRKAMHKVVRERRQKAVGEATRIRGTVQYKPNAHLLDSPWVAAWLDSESGRGSRVRKQHTASRTDQESENSIEAEQG